MSKQQRGRHWNLLVCTMAVTGSGVTDAAGFRIDFGEHLVLPADGLDQQEQPAAFSGLIVTYSSDDPQARQRIIARTRRLGLIVGFDLPRMNRVTIKGARGRNIAGIIAAYRRIPGVIAVERDQELTIDRRAG